MLEDTSHLWREACQILSRRVSSGRLRTWLLPLREAGLDDGKLLLLAPNEFVKRGVEKNYAALLRDALEEAAGREIRLKLAVDASLSHQSHEEGLNQSPGFMLRADLNFDTFVVGPCNRLAHASALAVADNPGNVYNPLFIYGKDGLGKTHLLQATCRRLLSQRPGLDVVYLPCGSFVSAYINALERSSLAQFQNEYADVDALVVDDMQLLSGRPQAQELFFHIFNLLYDAKTQIVLSADARPQDIDSLEARLASRFTWGLVARIDPPTFETRVAILRKKVESQGLSVEDGVIKLIAETVTPNVQELVGALTRILAYASLAGSKLTEDLAREALGQADGFRKRPSIDDILIAVTRRLGVTVADIQSKNRSKSLVFARQVSMYLARRLTKHSLQEIGGYFGGRDHTTVLRAVTRVEERARKEQGFQKLLLELETAL